MEKRKFEKLEVVRCPAIEGYKLLVACELCPQAIRTYSNGVVNTKITQNFVDCNYRDVVEGKDE